LPKAHAHAHAYKLLDCKFYYESKGPGVFNEPIFNFIPELKKVALQQERELNIMKQVVWKKVTLGALASHMAGLGNICETHVTPREMIEPDWRYN